MTYEDFKIGDICTYLNIGTNKREIIEVADMCKEYMHCKHLDEPGSWIVYYNNPTLTKPNNELKDIFKKQALDIKLKIVKGMMSNDRWYDRHYVN